jgi:lysophospholipase L1-like esterase
MSRRRPLAPALSVLLLLALALPASGQAAAPGPYVALGDSFTAAPLVPNQVNEPAGCSRSDHNYPSIVAAALGAWPFVDRSCSAARTDHMMQPQGVRLGSNPPQFDGLSSDTGVVTIGIGGNDVGLVGAALKCLQTGLLAPTGTACRTTFAKPDGGDKLVDQIAATGPKIAATLQAIHARSPHARVLIVGYPAVAPRNGKGCYPLVPLSDDDMIYLEGMLRRTNAMLAEQAAANDTEYVDTYEESSGHDVCTAIGTRWFEGLVPMSLAFPVHPNALGEESMARSVLRVLAQPRPGPVLSSLRRSKRSIKAGGALRILYTLNRAARVTIAVQRSRGGGRYTRLRGFATMDANAGENAITLTARQLGRRAGLYRVTATTVEGTVQRTQFRIRRAR